HCVTGRLPALLKRFETTTLELWKRHGIRQAGFWTVMVGPGGNQDLHYLLAWESLAERETKWTKFASDPEWLAKRAESAKDGPIVAWVNNRFLNPTSFSSVKGRPSRHKGISSTRSVGAAPRPTHRGRSAATSRRYGLRRPPAGGRIRRVARSRCRASR